MFNVDGKSFPFNIFDNDTGQTTRSDDDEHNNKNNNNKFICVYIAMLYKVLQI